MKIKNFKIQVNPEQSRIVQQTLFDNGIYWCGSDKTIHNTEQPHLFINFSITYGNGSYYFNGHCLPEITFQEFEELYIKKEFVLPEKWCIRPRSIKEDEILINWRGGGHSSHFSEVYLVSDKVWTLKRYTFNYTEITFKQFKKYVLKEDIKEALKEKIMNKEDKITISVAKVREYYDAASATQRDYLTKHFKLNGETTVGAIVGLRDIACSNWKPIIEKNHPECFIEDKNVIVDKNFMDFYLQPRISCELKNKAIFLSDYYNWELIKDSEDVLCLVPTKK